ncbi:haloacid dehalogenase, type II [Actinomadura sp. CNU-125]|uniref:haloacid dehalogenase type II n=1 Tax=Actinomadura sp. CNU-125 TaxID=1904961 RepID=UPI0009618893|nr:haloacid dehalogenase type II [Actinomadura sp. CNU-125]OLT10485.1 haloacid dehalogenase, type II [Actinomadura sp. CNU-125]
MIQVVLFDVNETLGDLSSLRGRLEDVGAPGHLLPTWFAGTLRDGMGLTAAGAYADFAEVAECGLRSLLTGLDGWAGDARRAAAHVVSGFTDLDVHPDVPDAVRALRSAGLRPATLTNGSAAVTESLLERAGVRDLFEAPLDVSVPRAWKPAAAAYRHAVDRLGVAPDRILLVAVHPWDVDGARRAGLRAAWLNRGALPYPSMFERPDHTITDLRDLPGVLERRPGA